MMWQQFTVQAQQVIHFSLEESARHNIREVTPEHILIGIMLRVDNVAAKALAPLDAVRSRVEAEVREQASTPPRKLWFMPKGTKGEIKLSTRGKRAIDIGYEEARLQSSEKINTGHLLLGILREGGGAAQLLQKNGVTLDETRTTVKEAGSESDSKETMWERFTNQAQRAIYCSQEEAALFNVIKVTPEHILMGILRDTDTFALRVLTDQRVDKNLIEREIRAANPIPDSNPWVLKKHMTRDMELSVRAKNGIDFSYFESSSQSREEINTGYLLLGILREGGTAAQILQAHGITLDAARTTMQQLGSERTIEDNK